METETTLERTSVDEMTCPACNARQEWSAACRRCKCDLSLLQRYQRSCVAHRRRCLQALDDGALDRALQHATRYSALAGESHAASLLAACHLLSGDWEKALLVARI